MSKGEEKQIHEIGRKVCPVCGREFWPTSIDWAYKTTSGKHVYYCRYNCYLTTIKTPKYAKKMREWI